MLLYGNKYVRRMQDTFTRIYIYLFKHFLAWLEFLSLHLLKKDLKS